MGTIHLKNNKRILTNYRIRPDYLEGIDILYDKQNSGKDKKDFITKSNIVESAIIKHLNSELGKKRTRDLEREWIKRGANGVGK